MIIVFFIFGELIRSQYLLTECVNLIIIIGTISIILLASHFICCLDSESICIIMNLFLEHFIAVWFVFESIPWIVLFSLAVWILPLETFGDQQVHVPLGFVAFSQVLVADGFVLLEVVEFIWAMCFFQALGEDLAYTFAVDLAWVFDGLFVLFYGQILLLNDEKASLLVVLWNLWHTVWFRYSTNALRYLPFLENISHIWNVPSIKHIEFFWFFKVWAQGAVEILHSVYLPSVHFVVLTQTLRVRYHSFIFTWPRNLHSRIMSWVPKLHALALLLFAVSVDIHRFLMSWSILPIISLVALSFISDILMLIINIFIVDILIVIFNLLNYYLLLFLFEKLLVFLEFLLLEVGGQVGCILGIFSGWKHCLSCRVKLLIVALLVRLMATCHSGLWLNDLIFIH